MEKKLRSIPVILFALIVIWVVVAAIIYQNYRAKVVLQLDGQMTLLANHPWLERLQTHSTLTKSQSVTTLPADFPMVQNGPFFGVLFDQSQVNDDEYIWFINRQPMPSDALMLADVRAKLAGHMGEASSQVIPIEASQSSWRVLLQPMADNQTGFVAILANVDNLLLVHASLLLWLFLLMALLVGISYCIFQWRFKHLKSRWMQLIKKARIDELTGLPNQQQLLRDLDGVKHTNLAFLKIHNFNSILNNYGPAVTDNVIRQVSAVLSNFEHPLLKKPSCYHLQPAVFAILEDQEISYEGIAAITKSLVKSIITTPYQVNEGEYVSVNLTTGAVRQNQDA
ncbi:MAG: GGDEF domain-containing protein, partial [Marinicella sp.]